MNKDQFEIQEDAVEALRRMSGSTRCECGEWSSVACEWSGPIADTVVVEVMPVQHRASHAAAGNNGSYPHNGAKRLRVARSCAKDLLAADGEWCHEVETC